MAEKVPGWLERVLLPQIGEVKGELRVANARIEALDQKLNAKVDGLDGKMEGEFKAVHSEMRRLDERMDSFDKKPDITQRLAIVESEVRELETRN